MATRVVQPASVATAVALHVAVALVLIVVLGREGSRRPPDTPVPLERLVWVEPAPPAMGIAGGAGTPAAASASASAPRAPRVEPVAEPARPALAARGAAPPSIVRAPPRPARTARPARAKEPPASASVGATSDGTAAGVPRSDAVSPGVAGGVAGGLGDAPLALGAVARPPELVERVLPEYPARARALEVEGQVLLEVVLDREGRPETDVRVVRSVPMLDAAAIAAVRQWRFRPARDADGRAVRVVMQVPVRFELR